jgi:RNase_H superfamily
LTARTLVYDIETTPNLGYVWGKWEQDVIEFEQEWHFLSFAYKWLGADETKCISLRQFRKDYKQDPTDDRRVVETLHSLFNEADVVVAHNGDRFDQLKSNSRFLVHGFAPPSPYQQIDTLKIARRYFAFNSNKLNDLGKTLGLGEKVETGGFKTWLGCMAGDRASWERMEAYNIQDVLLLEKVYLKLRPWIEGHPNMAFLNDAMEACVYCASPNLTKQGIRKTRTMTYRRVQCKDCGGWSRSRLSEKDAPKPTYTN